VTSAPLPAAQVDVLPARGPLQTCQTEAFGTCPPLWVLHGSLQLRGTKAGYQPGDLTVTLPNGSFSQLTNLRLAPLSQ